MKPVEIARAVAAARDGKLIMLKEVVVDSFCNECSEPASFVGRLGVYYCSNGHTWLVQPKQASLPTERSLTNINLDEYWVYRFIRTDIPERQHIIQVGHSSWNAGAAFGNIYGIQPGIPFNITIAVGSAEELQRVARKLREASIGFDLFTDTDVSSEPTALTTFPVTSEQRQTYFSKYRTYSPPSSSLPEQETGFNAERGAISEVEAAVDRVMKAIHSTEEIEDAGVEGTI